VRDRLEGRWPHQSQGAVVRVCAALLLYRLRGSVRGHNYIQLTRLGHRIHANNNSRRKRHRHRPSILSPSVQSEDTTSGSTTTRTVTLSQAMSEVPSQAQTRAHTQAGVPIPSSPFPPPQFSPHPPGDLSTTPTSFVTAPPTIVSRTTDSGGDGRTPDMLNEGAGATEHYPPPHTGVHTFMPFPFYVSVLLFTRNLFGFSLLAMLQLSLHFLLDLTCTYSVVVYISIGLFPHRHAFIFYAFTNSHSPTPYPLLLPLHRTRSTPLNPYLPLRVHVLRYLLFTSSPSPYPQLCPLHATLGPSVGKC
jgi:hypothetical protein